MRRGGSWRPPAGCSGCGQAQRRLRDGGIPGAGPHPLGFLWGSPYRFSVKLHSRAVKRREPGGKAGNAEKDERGGNLKVFCASLR